MRKGGRRHSEGADRTYEEFIDGILSTYNPNIQFQKSSNKEYN